MKQRWTIREIEDEGFIVVAVDALDGAEDAGVFFKTSSGARAFQRLMCRLDPDLEQTMNDPGFVMTAARGFLQKQKSRYKM